MYRPGRQCHNDTPVADQTGLSTPNATVSICCQNAFYWRVSANSFGTSAWSSVRSFTAGVYPSQGKKKQNKSDFYAGT
jgi:hypothetical protein